MLAGGIILLSLIDLFLSYYGYKHGLLYELNPLMREAFRNFWLAFLIKMGLTVVGVIILYPRRKILQFIFVGYVCILCVHLIGVFL